MKRISAIFFMSFAVFLYSANVNVDELSIIADGAYSNSSGLFEMNTFMKFTTSFDGGFKFAANAAFEANIREVERNYLINDNIYDKVFLIFKHAEVTANNLAEEHLNLSFWTGVHGYLGAGNIYRGYLYYPENQSDDFAGFYRLRGTGISAEMKFWRDQFRSKFHFYQNTNFISANNQLAFHYFSFDNETGLYMNFSDQFSENILINLVFFGGITFPVDSSVRGKVGMSFKVGNEHLDFFVSVGMPKLDINIASTTFDSLYLVAELNFRIGYTQNTLTFLTRPTYFNEAETGAVNDFDINYKFRVVVPDFWLRGGFNLNFKFSQTDPQDFWRLYLTPYIDMEFSGVVYTVSMHYDFSRIYAANLTGNPMLSLEGLGVVIGVSSKF